MKCHMKKYIPWFIYEKCAKSGEFYFGRRCYDCEKGL